MRLVVPARSERRDRVGEVVLLSADVGEVDAHGHHHPPIGQADDHQAFGGVEAE